MTDVDTELFEVAGSDEVEPRLYEAGYHLIPTIKEEDVSLEVGRIKDAIEKYKGIIVTEEAPKTMKLAYSISKVIAQKRINFDASFFGWIKFHMAPAQLQKLYSDLSHFDATLRFILIETTLERAVDIKKMTFLSGKTPRREKKVEAEALSEEELEKTIEQLVAE